MQFRLQHQARFSIQVLFNLYKALRHFGINKESKNGVNFLPQFRHRRLVSQQYSLHLKLFNQIRH